MAVETNYTNLRENLSSYLDRVTDDREVIIVRRKGARDVALVSADDLASWMESAYLLRSPTNAKRLLESLDEVRQGSLQPESVEGLRRSVGLEQVP